MIAACSQGEILLVSDEDGGLQQRVHRGNTENTKKENWSCCVVCRSHEARCSLRLSVTSALLFGRYSSVSAFTAPPLHALC